MLNFHIYILLIGINCDVQTSVKLHLDVRQVCRHLQRGMASSWPLMAHPNVHWFLYHLFYFMSPSICLLKPGSYLTGSLFFITSFCIISWVKFTSKISFRSSLVHDHFVSLVTCLCCCALIAAISARDIWTVWFLWLMKRVLCFALC